MRKANEESLDSPFKKNGSLKPFCSTRVLKQKLCGGVSEASPSYFHLNHINVLDEKNRTQELFKGYKVSEKNDLKLVTHPELVPQEKKLFEYEDYKMNSGLKVFDYSSMKPSNLIDMMADKRPFFKSSSNYYQKYNEELNKNGFRRTRGIFTIESNQRHKFGKTISSRFPGYEELAKETFVVKKASERENVDKQIIRQLSDFQLPVSIRSGKKNMVRFLNRKVSYS